MKQLTILLLAFFAVPVIADDVKIGVGDTNRVALSFENGKFGGSLAGLYQCALDAAGLHYEVRFYPQVRVLRLLRQGEIHLGLPLARLADRDVYATFTKPMLITRFHLFTHKDIAANSDVSAYTFAVLRASASTRMASMRGAKFAEVSSWTQALSLAKLGRYDGAIIPAPIVADLDASDLEGLKRVEFGTIPVSIYVSKHVDNSAQLVSRLNAAIDTCAAARKNSQ